MLLKEKSLNKNQEELILKPVIAKDYCDFKVWYTDAGGIFLVKLNKQGEIDTSDGFAKLYDEVEIGIHSVEKTIFDQKFTFILDEEYELIMSFQEEGIDMETFKSICKKYSVDF